MGRLLRFLVIFVIAGLILTVVRRALAQRTNTEGRAQRKMELMVQCAYCGLHLPESDALFTGKLAFCSDNHRRSKLDSNRD